MGLKSAFLTKGWATPREQTSCKCRNVRRIHEGKDVETMRREAVPGTRDLRSRFRRRPMDTGTFLQLALEGLART
jgi:hypothetical protein